MESTKNKIFMPIPIDAEEAAKVVLDSAFRVHTALGPGLLELIYEACLTHELRKCGQTVETQVAVPIIYDGVLLEQAFRIDLLVNQCLIVEIKAVEELNKLFEAQVLTYLKITGYRLGLLINFNVPHLKTGIKRLVL